jgi:hypothetical protein
MQPMRGPSIRAMLRRLLMLDADSIISPQLLTSTLLVCARMLSHTGTSPIGFI